MACPPHVQNRLFEWGDPHRISHQTLEMVLRGPTASDAASVPGMVVGRCVGRNRSSPAPHRVSVGHGLHCSTSFVASSRHALRKCHATSKTLLLLEGKPCEDYDLQYLSESDSPRSSRLLKDRAGCLRQIQPSPQLPLCLPRLAFSPRLSRQPFDLERRGPHERDIFGPLQPSKMRR